MGKDSDKAVSPSFIKHLYHFVQLTLKQTIPLTLSHNSSTAPRGKPAIFQCPYLSSHKVFPHAFFFFLTSFFDCSMWTFSHVTLSKGGCFLSQKPHTVRLQEVGTLSVSYSSSQDIYSPCPCKPSAMSKKVPGLRHHPCLSNTL